MSRTSTSSTSVASGQDRPGGGRSSGGGVRPARRLAALAVALLSVVAVGVAAPAVADQRADSTSLAITSTTSSTSTTSTSTASTTTATAQGDDAWTTRPQVAPLKGDPSIWPKPNIVQTNLSATQSEQMVGDCPLYHLCVRNQEADGLWSAYALYYCLPAGQYYELTNFTGTVYAQNSQDVAVRLLRADNSEVDRIGALTGKNVYWNPVWKIDLC